jgi:hypothetical protein
MAPSNRSPRLPARVFWFRRTLVLGTAFALIYGVAQLIGGVGGDDPSSAAKVTAGKPTPTASVTQPPIGPLPANVTATAAGGGALGDEIAPDGPCDLSDITVTPVAGTAPAGRTVPLTLELSGIQPACSLAVSPKTIVAKVSTKNGKVWSSQDCPSAVPTSSVVVRSGTPTTIQLAWNGRRSDATCSRATDWALPATYQVTAAAFGSEPSDADVKLTTPPRPVVIKTIKPKAPMAITTKKPGKAGSTSSPTTPDTGRRAAG